MGCFLGKGFTRQRQNRSKVRQPERLQRRRVTLQRVARTESALGGPKPWTSRSDQNRKSCRRCRRPSRNARSRKRRRTKTRRKRIVPARERIDVSASCIAV